MKAISIGDVRIPLDAYAVGGTAVLGIRESGKTYLSKGIAEQLLEFEIPIIVFDAIGQWRHIKTPNPGISLASAHTRPKGFKVVVAGGKEPDLPLTPHSAPEIVRAAIRENIPLVIDLYDKRLSKADWRRIVQECFRTLLYENEGVRHIFLEETAEYAPQKVLDGQTYAEVEKLVRMGGNASLGITLINQRSQEVNKAVLDLCENVVLMRQRGAHAIDALQKWTDKLSPDQAKQIASEMPKMKQGECWIFTGDTEHATKTKSGTIRSFHPDRRNPKITAKGAATDTSDFVSRLSGKLGKLVEEQKANDPAVLKRRIRELEHQRMTRIDIDPAGVQRNVREAEQRGYASAKADCNRWLIETLEGMRSHIAGRLEAATKVTIDDVFKDFPARMDERSRQFKRIVDAIPVVKQRMIGVDHGRPGSDKTVVTRVSMHGGTPTFISGIEISGLKRRLLNAIARLNVDGIEPVAREAAAAMAGSKASGGYAANMIGELKTAGLIDYPAAGMLALTDVGRPLADPDAINGSLADHWLQIEKGLKREILRVLIDNHPQAMSREEVGDALGKSAEGGYFANMIGELKMAGAIEYPRPGALALTRNVMP